MVAMQKNNSEAITIPLSESFTQKEAKKVIVTIEQKMKEGNSQFELDASELEFIDSSGIGSLVKILGKVRSAKGDICLLNICASIENLFKQTGLDSIFTIKKSQKIEKAREDLFSTSVDIKVEIIYESVRDIGVLHLVGLMNNRADSLKLKHQILLALEDKKKILLDLERLTYFDSIAAGEFVNIYRLLSSLEAELRICGANELVKELLNTIQMQSFVTLFPTMDEALENW